MDWSKGFSSRYLAYEVDPVTWRDTTSFDIISGAINSTDDLLIQSCDLSCTDFDGSEEKWVRVYLEASQEDDSYYGALFTGLASSSNIEISGLSKTTPVQCYSVLKPVDDILLPKGWFASAGSDAIATVQSLLSVSPAPIVVEGAGRNLIETLVAESGETNLSMAVKILNALNWYIHIDGDGTIRLRPVVVSNEPKVIFDSAMNDCLETSVTVENNWFQSPNVFRASYGDIMAVIRDESPTSQLSVQNRGREIWAEETDCTLNDGENIADYAKRRLKELQQNVYKVSYTRRFYPGVEIGDTIGLNYAAQNLSGYFRVITQSITLGHNASVSESANKI